MLNPILFTESRNDIDALLKGKLSDVLTSEQQANRIRNLLLTMNSKDKSICNRGSRKHPEWVLTVNKSVIKSAGSVKLHDQRST